MIEIILFLPWFIFAAIWLCSWLCGYDDIMTLAVSGMLFCSGVDIGMALHARRERRRADKIKVQTNPPCEKEKEERRS